MLVDTEHLYFLANKQALATVGIELTEAQYVEFFLVKNSGAWHLAAERGISPEGIETIRAARNAAFSSLINGNFAISGVHEVLTHLHRRYAMGIVTSSEREHFNLIHQHSGLLHFFDFVLAMGDYPRSKPHPDPYLAAVERSGFAKDECIVIEDSARGLAAAVAAGLRCYVVPSDLTRGSDFSSAHMVLGSVEELLVELGV